MAHGDHKTPGGKLMRVDFDVVDDRFTHVVVSGDFFLYPDEALDDLRSAVEGAPVTITEDALAARIAAAMRPGAELIGSSPESLAIAVRRGLLEAGFAHE